MWTPELAYLASYTQHLRTRLALSDDPAHLEEEADLPLSYPVEDLSMLYQLDDDDIDILLFAAALKLDPGLRIQVAALCHPLSINYPCPYAWLRLISAKEPRRFWQEQWRFGADRPLRRLGFVELRAEPSDLLVGELRVSSDVLSMLRGERSVDERLGRYVTLLEPEDGAAFPTLPQALKTRFEGLIRGLLSTQNQTSPLEPWLPMVLIDGPRGAGKTALVRATCQRLQRSVLVVRAEALSHAPDPAQLVWLAVRQAALHEDVLFFDDAERLLAEGSAAAATLCEAAATYRAVVMITSRELQRLDLRVRDRAPARFTLPGQHLQSRREIWENALRRNHLDVEADGLAQRYPLDGRQIHNAAALARTLSKGQAARGVLSDAKEVLTEAARLQLEDGLGSLGTVSQASLGRGDLILPDLLSEQLDELIAAFGHRHQLFDEWGFRARVHRGQGLICLFDGEPGTGKTLCAEVLAHELGLKLVQINTSQVIDKYIGETEKRLAAIFEGAHPNLNLLLFDEADSLFAKRTKVERATDRYANGAINVLLQLVERYEGLVVLTTNLKKGIDPAFERRFSFKLSFPIPGVVQREAIWRRFIPAEAPIEGELDFDYLARELDLSGGGIKNAVVRAGYLALRAGTPLHMDHLIEAGYRELASSGKLVRREEE